MSPKKRDDPIDRVRTIYWFRLLSQSLGTSSPRQLEKLLKGDDLLDIHGELKRAPTFADYARGDHVPRGKMVELAEQFAPSTSRCLNHLLWTVLREPWRPLEKDASDMVRLLSTDIQTLILDPAHRIRLEHGYHYLRALERRRSLDGLAALTLLTRLSIERQCQEQLHQYAQSLLRVLLVLGEMLIERGVGEVLFAIYVDRVFSKIRFDGMRFDFSDYPFSMLAKELQFQVYARAQYSDRRDRPDEVISKILAGQYAQSFKIMAAPRIVPALDIGRPSKEVIEDGKSQHPLIDPQAGLGTL